MEPARVRTDDLGHGSGEGDYVMLDLGFNFEDAFNLEGGARADRLGGVFRHNAGGGEGFGRGDSTASQVRKRFSSLQMRAISGRV